MNHLKRFLPVWFLMKNPKLLFAILKGTRAALKHEVANGFVMQLSAYRWDALGCVEVGPRTETGIEKPRLLLTL